MSTLPLAGPSADGQRWLLPCATALAEECQARLAQLQLPQLSALLAQLVALPSPPDLGDEDSLSTPHERVLADWLDWRAPGGGDWADGQLPWAALHQAQATAPNGTAQTAPDTVPMAWFDLCHFEVAMDHVRLLPGSALAITEAESDALRQALAPWCAEDGIALSPGPHPSRWLARGPSLAGAACASLDRVAGRALPPAWLNSLGQHPLKRLQSEAQMLFYTQACNDARAEARQAAINGLWISGAGALPATGPADGGTALPQRPWPHLAWDLREPAWGGDWAEWEQRWLALDGGLFAELRGRVDGGESVQIALCGERSARCFASPARPPSWPQRLWRQWQTPTPAAAVLKTL